MERIEGKIAAILDRSTVVINRGSRDGVTEDDEVYIYSTVGPFEDPDTKESLGATQTIWGKVIVSIVEERFSIAQTEYSSRFDMEFLAKVFAGSRIELPVKDSEISRNLTRIEIGSTVVVRKLKNALSSQTEQLNEQESQRLLEGPTSNDNGDLDESQQSDVAG